MEQFFFREAPLNANYDGWDGEPSLEKCCCNLCPEYTVGLARMVREDDHNFKMSHLRNSFKKG
jgi:hypothetical protein